MRTGQGRLRSGVPSTKAERRCRQRIGSEGIRFLRTGLHRNDIGQIERAEVNPTLGSVERIAGALDVTPTELIALAEQLQT